MLHGQTMEPLALLQDLVATDRTGWWWLPRYLPTLVRTALALGDHRLADAIVEGFEPLMPYGTHSLVAATAAVIEARGDLAAAAAAYEDAAARWERFGVVPEHAFALLGQGRSLVAAGWPAEAAPVLECAQAIFERLRAAPSLAEIDALLRQATGTPAEAHKA